MLFPIAKLNVKEFHPLLQEIPQPPTTLNYRGILPSSDMKLLAVVGSRKYSDYGMQAVQHLIGGLRGHNIGIVSGLALGIDSLAHTAALENNIYTLSIPGSGLNDNVIYPASHKRLAYKILESGGGLLSEFDPDFTATKWSFPQRNRLVCGISHATLIVEAAEKSGTLITARMASDYNRELLTVPGSIFSKNTVGCHQFLKLGAIPATEPNDILYALGIDPEKDQKETVSLSSLSDTEIRILELLNEPTERNLLLRQLLLPTHETNAVLMEMEIKGFIIETEGIYRTA